MNIIKTLVVVLAASIALIGCDKFHKPTTTTEPAPIPTNKKPLAPENEQLPSKPWPVPEEKAPEEKKPEKKPEEKNWFEKFNEEWDRKHPQ